MELVQYFHVLMDLEGTTEVIKTLTELCAWGMQMVIRIDIDGQCVFKLQVWLCNGVWICCQNILLGSTCCEYWGTACSFRLIIDHKIYIRGMDWWNIWEFKEKARLLYCWVSVEVKDRWEMQLTYTLVRNVWNMWLVLRLSQISCWIVMNEHQSNPTRL